jgi:very-short-patch-repair endonuclease
VLRRGVFADAAAAAAADPHRLAVAAALATMADGAVASHASAAHILGLLTIRPVGPITWLTRPPTSRHGTHRHFGVLERAAPLPPGHVTVIDGIATTSIARTVVDLARLWPFGEGLAIADAALHDRRTTLRALAAVADRCENWPGIARATRVLTLADAAAESALESLSRAMFVDYGLSMPQLQVNIRANGRHLGRGDFLWMPSKVIGEADGRGKYQDPTDLWNEKLREDRLRDAGFEVVRWIWDDVVLRPGQTVERIKAAILRAEARLGGAAHP